jgi:hypothetical protein
MGTRMPFRDSANRGVAAEDFERPETAPRGDQPRVPGLETGSNFQSPPTPALLMITA